MSGAIILARKQPPLVWLPTNAGNQDLSGIVQNRQDAGKPYSLQKASNLANSFQMKAGKGDFFSTETDRVRSELQSTLKTPRLKWLYGSEWFRWSATSFLAPYFVALQLHQTGDSDEKQGFPPWEIDVLPDGTANIWYSADPRPYADTFYTRTLAASGIPLAPNVLHKIDYGVCMDYAGAGAFFVRIDGQLIVSLTNIAIGMNDVVGTYSKRGLYFTGDSDTFITAQHFDIWEGYNDLSSRFGLSPPSVIGPM